MIAQFLQPEALALAAAFLVAATLYSSVGHGGASAYLAIMALFALPPETMRPTALTLNLIVAGYGAWRFVRAGRFDARVFWPIALAAAPAAFVGGMIALPAEVYRLALGVVLLVAATRLAMPDTPQTGGELRAPAWPIAAGAGAGIGLAAGLTGTGGGIFLSPLLIFLRWTRAETTTGIASLFIVINSAAGLAGNVTAFQSLPAQLPLYAGAVALGGLLGVWLGLAQYSTLMLRRALAVVMVVAGLKLIFF